MIGLGNKERYCIYTRLIDDPNVRLYYKGLDKSENASDVLSVVVGFSKEDSIVMNKETAKEICSQLNENLDTLLAHGFDKFKISQLTVVKAGK